MYHLFETEMRSISEFNEETLRLVFHRFFLPECGNRNRDWLRLRYFNYVGVRALLLQNGPLLGNCSLHMLWVRDAGVIPKEGSH